MATPVWQPGTLYSPGSIVTPTSTAQITQTPPTNASFEDGLTGWDQDFEGGTGTWEATAPGFDGAESANFIADIGGSNHRGSVIGLLRNTFLAPVRPGQTINFSCRVSRNTAPDHQSWELGGCRIDWYNGSSEFISSSWPTSAQNPNANAGSNDLTGTFGLISGSSSGSWVKDIGTGIAPAGAAFAQFVAVAVDNTHGSVRIDDCVWDYTFQGVPDGLVFTAVQANNGFSGAVEPTWPIVNGQQVIDNEVTWEAVFASRVVWEASPILVSGDYEPDFPEEAGGTVADGSIAWEAMDHRITDPKCPNSTAVAIAASKIFAGDEDIIAFSATVNPLDWSTEEDAGFLPFGLQTYGKNDVKALGLYRGNLVAFNSEGYQMWQVDEDPANMALLDAQPIDCQYARSVQAAANDLLFLTAVGVRSIGIAGASTNLQAGFFGKQIDPLVLLALRETGGEGCADPIALYYPGAGQYWIIFDEQAFVLTMNGGKNDMSWSRYFFPAAITDWTILNGDLYLRAGDLVWRLSEDALMDDEEEPIFRALEDGCAIRATESGDLRIVE